MTKEELIALRRERGKQELDFGDRVKVYDQNGNLMYGGKVATIVEKGIIGNDEMYYGLYIEGTTMDKYSVPNPLNPKYQVIGRTSLFAPFFAEDLELVKEPTDKIKVGDRVRTPSGIGNVVSACNGNIFVELDSGEMWVNTFRQPTKLQDNPNNKEDKTDNTITIPVKVDLDDTYWDAYRAELVKEIAVKLADKETIMCPSIADYATNFATRIVDNLKKQSE